MPEEMAALPAGGLCSVLSISSIFSSMLSFFLRYDAPRIPSSAVACVGLFFI